MKTSILLFSTCLFLLTACNQTNEKKNEVATSMIEKSIEAISGKEYDAADVNNMDKNKPEVDIVLDGKSINGNFKNAFGSITASKETIAITVSAGENQQENILLGFTAADLTTMRPIKGKITKGENGGFSFSMMKVSEQGAETFISLEAEGEIITMNEAKTVIKVKGSLTSTLDADTPEKWKHYEGTITLNCPVYQAIGNNKSDFNY